jgi:hypothetical protein
MDNILNNQRFVEVYDRLAGVRLNARRHTAANAKAHSEAVAQRAGVLGRANGCNDDEIQLLVNLGRAHDIGKVTGTTKTERSMEVLRQCGVEDPKCLRLVQWHDTSLPWYNASQKGHPPSEKAWRRLAVELDLRLLALFMVADRVDAPSGWRRNAPTKWFLGEAQRRGLVSDLRLDLSDHPSEVGVAAVLVRTRDGIRELLLLDAGTQAFDVAEADIDWDETPEDAAGRALSAVYSLQSPLQPWREIGYLDELAGEAPNQHMRRVRYFIVEPIVPADFSPSGVAGHRWVRHNELEGVPLAKESLRDLFRFALGGADGAGQ